MSRGWHQPEHIQNQERIEGSLLTKFKTERPCFTLLGSKQLLVAEFQLEMDPKILAEFCM